MTLPATVLPDAIGFFEVGMAQAQAPPEPNAQGPRDLSGTSVGRFLICAQLGVGGMGEVYRAEDTKLKRTVALKRIAPHLRADQYYRQRLLREAEYASRLNDPHIASIYDVVEDGDEMFLVMEYVEGQTMRQRLAQPLSVEEFLAIALQCAAALVAAHERRIIHGDIKPENIMLTPAGQVKILDFGLAKVLPRQDETTTQDQLSTRSGLFSGTPAYMAPEVLLQKEPDGRADIFSLGVVFYEALTGRHPFLSDSFIATSRRILEEAPPPLSQSNPRIPAELDRILGKLLAKDPDDRYATAADLLVDLRALQRQKKELFPSRHVMRASPKPKWLALTAGITIAMLVVLVSSFPWAQQRFKSWSGIHPVPREKLVAVLPFTVVGSDTQATAFSDGLTETLTAKLTQLTVDPTLQVVPAPEVRAKGVSTIDEAYKEFGVTLVVEGNLLRSGDYLRINVTVVDTHTRRQVRAKSLTIAASDPFAVQDQVVNAAVEMLEVEVQPREREALKTHGTQIASAYDFYLQGRGYLQNYDNAENIKNAIKVFDSALQLDPRYALAYAGRGDAYWKMYESSKDPRWVESSRQDCERALSIDNGLPAAHVCLGAFYGGTGHYQEAAAEFNRAIETEPTNDDAYREQAEAYQRLGRYAQAEATYRRAIELRPHYWAGYNWLGVFYYHRAQYREAAEMFEQVTALAPDNARGSYNLAASYVGQGQYADAIAVLRRSIASRPTATAFTDLGNAYFYLRRYDEADRAYEQAVKLDQADSLLWWNLGDGYYYSPGKRAQSAGAYQRAVSLAEERLRVNPKDADALGILTICHAMLGEKKLALESLRKGLQLTPADPELLFRAALVYNQFGDVPEALSWLGKAMSEGFSQTTVRDTPNFDHLRSDPSFQELLRPK
jgi:serine/threonine protein kinase/tetratricopeptide (TPR) repeat protein